MILSSFHLFQPQRLCCDHQAKVISYIYEIVNKSPKNILNPTQCCESGHNLMKVQSQISDHHNAKFTMDPFQHFQLQQKWMLNTLYLFSKKQTYYTNRLLVCVHLQCHWCQYIYPLHKSLQCRFLLHFFNSLQMTQFYY